MKKYLPIGKKIASLVLLLFIVVTLLGAGGQSNQDMTNRVRVFTRGIEFNFLDWTLKAIGIKISQIALGAVDYMSTEVQRQVVFEYLEQIWMIHRNEAKLYEIYADPDIQDPEQASQDLRKELSELRAHRDQLAPLAESILQNQVSHVVNEMGLTLGGQPIPPVLYHSTQLPWGLVISPRDEIRQIEFISLVPETTLEEQVKLENQVERNLDVSSLVVGIGGMGLYPTMVDETSNLNWLSEVIAHEWVHNFLTLRPLGFSYISSPELRTMNETAASIAGVEIGQAVIEKYYPELVPPPPAPEPAPSRSSPEESQVDVFNFNKEMRKTRERVDQLLAEKKINEAEEYMEQRRVEFWENGYRIRKLNQAWFAFHGAYADDPSGGAAGADPVGIAVRQLRTQSNTLAEFLNRISWMSSFEQLRRAVENPES